MKWLTYKRNLKKITELSKRKRFDLFPVNLNTTFKECGIIPQQFEWDFEKPSKSRNEDLFIYGVNSNEDTFVLRCLRLPEENDTCLKSASLILKIGTDIYDFEAVDLVSSDQSLSYKVNGLEIQVISPFRLIRIVFRGILRKRGVNGDYESVFARVRMFWSPVSKVVDFKTVNDASFIANQMEDFDVDDNLFEDRYEQYGELKGTVQFENETLSKVFFWGNKCKSFFEMNENLSRNYKRMYAYSKRGLAFHIGFSIDKNAKQSFLYGNCFFCFPNAEPVTKCTLTLNDCDHLLKITEFRLTTVGPRKFDVKINDGLQLCSSYFLKNMTINETNGMCLIVENNLIDTNELKQRVGEKLFLPEIIPNYEDYTIDIRSNKLSEKCGGKGLCLSQIWYLSQRTDSEGNIPKYIVPDGIVITTNGYKHFLDSNPSISEAIDELQTKVWKNQIENVREECNRIVEVVCGASLPTDLKSEISDRLKLIFGDGLDNVKFAVRSSAIGEDSEEMSSAGQMSSYLGVFGVERIFSAIVKCWASQFTHVAVEYKYGYGQLINMPMAVVVQEMVNCDVSGILFTCNPVDGDPRKVLITCNYGLCESVVSSRAEPDTVIVLVDPEKNEIKKIESIVVGSKKLAITMSDDGGTVETPLSNDDMSRYCLEDNKAIELTKIALFLKKCFGNERDIEWGIKDGVIYLLQSRPVTNLNGFSEWELMHELDRGTAREEPLASKANVGEVLPGSQTYLGYTFLMGCFAPPGAIRFNRAGIKGNYFYSPYVNPGWITVCNQFLFDLSGFSHFAPENPDSAMWRAMNYSMFGRNLREEIYEPKDKRLMPKIPLGLKIKAGVFFTREILHSSSRLKKETRKFENFKLLDANEWKSSKELFDHIIDSSYFIYKGLIRHQECTGNSMSGYIGVFSVFTKNEDENPHLFNDISLLFSNNKKVESVQLPQLLQKVAKCIEDGETFSKMSDEEAFNYLMNGNTEASRIFKEVLEQHGHRGYKEFDVGYLQLADNPKSTIQSLKNMVCRDHKFVEKRVLSPQEIISSLKSDLNWRQRLILRKFVLPWSQKGVGLREQSKSFLIRLLNEFRKALWNLAQLMTEEGRIPDKQLLFYLKLEELDRLVTIRDPTLVSRAKQRRKVFPKMDKLQFDEVTKGPNFVARNEDEHSIPSGDLINCEKVKGITVCIGKVEGRAAVAKNFDEVDNIKAGDILIAYSTDVGWSPYFPLLSGVVTEIGGLISHGAVIAREYGLPCIVGARYACNIFKTGDRVVLDAENGVIYKIASD